MERSTKIITKCEIEGLELTYNNLLIQLKKEKEEEEKYEITHEKKQINELDNKKYSQTISNIKKDIILKTLSLYGIEKIDSDFYQGQQSIGFNYKSLRVHLLNFNEDSNGIIYGKWVNKKQEKLILNDVINKIQSLNKYFLENEGILDLGYEKIKETSEKEKDLKLLVQCHDAIIRKKSSRKIFFDYMKDDYIKDFGGRFQFFFNLRPFKVEGSPYEIIKKVFEIADLSLKEVKKIQDKYMCVNIKADENLVDKLKEKPAE